MRVVKVSNRYILAKPSPLSTLLQLYKPSLGGPTLPTPCEAPKADHFLAMPCHRLPPSALSSSELGELSRDRRQPPSRHSLRLLPSSSMRPVLLTPTPSNP